MHAKMGLVATEVDTDHEREGAPMLEARCTKCGDTFNPADEDDLIHGVRTSNDEHQGDPCGGVGELLGEWH